MNTGWTVRVPASSANLGPGYDVLGLGLALDLVVKAQLAPAWSVQLSGFGMAELPTDDTHLTAATYTHSCAEHGWDPKPLALHIDNLIPTCGGLGGSSAAVVAGLALAQLVHLGSVDLERIFQEGAAIEGHPDNIAPAVFGGLQACGKGDQAFFTKTCPLHPKLSLLVVTPNVRADTDTMRRAMPNPVPQDVLDFTQTLLAKVMQGLQSGNPEDLRACSEDRRHQPYRFAVQPIPKKVFDIMNQLDGIEGAFLSGSGSTVAGWVLDGNHPDASLREALLHAGIDAPVQRVPVAHTGLRIG